MTFGHFRMRFFKIVPKCGGQRRAEPGGDRTFLSSAVEISEQVREHQNTFAGRGGAPVRRAACFVAETGIPVREPCCWNDPRNTLSSSSSSQSSWLPSA